MAMFLESAVEQPQEIKPVSILAIMEELSDITIDLSESLENFFQEEYNILTEESDEAEKEKKKESFKDKVGKTITNLIDRIRVAVVKIKQFLLYYISRAIGSKKFVRAPKELVTFMAGHSISYVFKNFADSSKFDEIRADLEKDKEAFNKAKADDVMFTMSADKFKGFLNPAKKSFEDIEKGIKSNANLNPEGAKLLQACVTFSLAVVHAITSKTKGLDKED
jgi:hypothetical protein